jgi:hypothetical protein
MATKYVIGDAVLRRENRTERRAVVDAVEENAIEDGMDGPIYHLVYQEGGDGWWPESAIEADSSGGA